MLSFSKHTCIMKMISFRFIFFQPFFKNNKNTLSKKSKNYKNLERLSYMKTKKWSWKIKLILGQWNRIFFCFFFFFFFWKTHEKLDWRTNHNHWKYVRNRKYVNTNSCILPISIHTQLQKRLWFPFHLKNAFKNILG